MSEKDIEYIRVAAYYIWENEGRPEGKDEEIWWKACAQTKECCQSKKRSCKAKKIVAKPVERSVTKVVKKPVAKVAKTAKKVVKKISPLPVKSAAKIITPLYGSVKK